MIRGRKLHRVRACMKNAVDAVVAYSFPKRTKGPRSSSSSELSSGRRRRTKAQGQIIVLLLVLLFFVFVFVFLCFDARRIPFWSPASTSSRSWCSSSRWYYQRYSRRGKTNGVLSTVYALFVRPRARSWRDLSLFLFWWFLNAREESS